MVTFHTSPADALGAVHREIRDGHHDGVPVRVLVAERTYPTTPEDLWDALTSAERIPRWLSPVSGDLRLGGRYQIEGNAGGDVLVCDAPRHLALTWEAQGMISWVDVHLTPTGPKTGAGTDAGTVLRLEHAADVPPDFWDAYGPGAVGVGWELMLLGLGEHLVDPGFEAAEVLAALAAPQDHPEHTAHLGVITNGANDGWAEASVAYGTDPEQARAAAGRTLAFYTGGEPEGS